jgi:Uma2 family endonuclease
MSTITSPPPSLPMSQAQSPPVSVSDTTGEKRITLRGISWDLYDRLSDAIGEDQHVRLTYDGKDLEIMSTGYRHEDLKGLLGRLVNAVTVELDITCTDGGQTTWKRPDIERGLEADECYFFEPEKIAVIAEALGRKSNDVADYPNPDLAIEIELSRSEVDRPGIYAALRVAEVWRFVGETVVFEQLQEDGSYSRVNTSQFLPIRPEEVTRWITDGDVVNRTAWERRLRAWIRAELMPRMKQ